VRRGVFDGINIALRGSESRGEAHEGTSPGLHRGKAPEPPTPKEDKLHDEKKKTKKRRGNTPGSLPPIPRKIQEEIHT